jgi:hypothetical protein
MKMNNISKRNSFSQIIKTVGLVLVTTLAINQSYAGGLDNLIKYAQQDGTMSNTTKSSIVKDQQGGYLTGGSIIMRGPQPKTLQPLLIQTPKFAYDACTGSADFRFGGISFIGSKEFTDFLTRIPKVAGSYAAKMLFKTVCPQCEAAIADLEAIARDINSLMMDQCAAGQAIAEGAFNILSNTGQQRCLVQGNASSNKPSDMYQASQRCKDNPDRYGDISEEGELKSLLGDEFNLVWKALGKQDAAGRAAELGSHNFKELIMSISGTIIGKKVAGAFQFTNKPSLALSSDMLEQYMGFSDGDSNMKQYKCDSNDKCINPTEVTVTLTSKDTLYGNVSRIMRGIVEKLSKKHAIVRRNAGTSATNASANPAPAIKDQYTDEEEALIASATGIAIIPLIEAEMAGKAKAEDMLVRMSEVIEAVCYDVIVNFLGAMVYKAEHAVESLEYAQVGDIKAIENFTKKAQEVRRFLEDAKHTAYKRVNLINQVRERIRNQQKVFEFEFGRAMQNIK